MSDLAQIQTFIEVAQTNSFVMASHNLSLPRSTVSARVKSLEKRLGVRLFNRNTRKISLTNEGIAYLVDCQKALDLLFQAEDRFLAKESLAGSIKVTIPISTPFKPFSQLLVGFSKAYPELGVETLVSDDTLDLIEHNIDVAIRGRDPGHMDLIAREIGHTRVSFYASPHFNAIQGDYALDSLLEEHCLIDVGSRGKGSAKLGTTNFDLAKELVLQEQGIMALPDSLCTQELIDKQLIKLSSPNPPSPLVLYLVYSSTKHMPLRVRAFIDYFMAHYKLFGIL
jgi:DNA-binding transcriptional LysR family regulator